MSRVDLHPEELLHAARNGRTPTAADQARLEEHVAQCDACSFEQAVARDFGAALEREDTGARAAAARAIAGALTDPRVKAIAAAGTIGRPAARPLSRGLLVAAIVLGTGIATASGVWFAVSLTRANAPDDRRPPAADASGTATTVDAPACEPVAPPVLAPRPPAPSAVPESPPEAVPEPPPPVASNAPPSPVSPHVLRPPAPHAPPPPPAGDTAPTIFSRANTARRVGEFGAAVRAYEELRRRYPGSREEVLSRATFGTLLLEVLGQPQRALGLFDSYLADAPGGTLAEEALVGRAEALGRLGRTAEEQAAWDVLLDRFPDSSRADRARRRLEELR
ncbi:MAG: tetratricopeptide repeat protein [Deltaproteobacteria bacterium]|nr:tetratricopeptide repeat protein [Deltaproteobacteria bacterium]